MNNKLAKNNFDKPKEFKTSLIRLIKELKAFKILIIISLVLATIGSIIAIFTPNMLSNLTDTISEGLIVNKSNLEKITKEITTQVKEEDFIKIIDINLSQEKINEVLTNNNIKEEDKNEFKELISDSNNILSNIGNLNQDILKILIEDSTYNNVNISSEEKINLLISMTKGNELNISKNMANALFTTIEVDKTSINPYDQAKFISLVYSLDKEDVNALYDKLSMMPDSIKSLIEPTMNMEKIKHIALVLLILYIVSSLFTYIEAICMTDVSNKFAKKLRNNISTKINRLPLKFFDKNPIGDILSRVTNDVDMIAQSLNTSLSTLVSAITLLIGTIIMMFITNFVMALTAIISSLLGFIFMFVVLGKSQKYFAQKQEQLGNLNAHIEEIYSGLNVVKAYNGREITDIKFDDLNNKLYNANFKSQFLSGLMMPMMTFIGNFGYVMVCIVGALLTINGYISFGVIVAFITYVRLFTSPLSQIAQAMTNVQLTVAAGERVFEFIDEEEMQNQKNIVKYLNKNKVKGNIVFNNVSFTYDGNDKPTIKDFSAEAKPGQKIAIVGPTGAGKTTMVNLLMKFYEISDGDIKIDGISTKELSRENIHELFTMVLQDTWLFDGTIKENIIYNRKNISDEKVKEVCKTVGLDHFIKTLPEGYNSILSDNESISVGQKQLLTIARGMIEDSPFLILDEATSNVDTRTEELVQEAMDKLTKGKTSFIIAHRLSTIKNADLILVMKDGNIIEQGNHDELIKKNGFYASLYNSQFEL